MQHTQQTAPNVCCLDCPTCMTVHMLPVTFVTGFSSCTAINGEHAPRLYRKLHVAAWCDVQADVMCVIYSCCMV